MKQQAAIVLVALALACAALAGSTPAGAERPAQANLARVRFVHAALDASELDAYVDGRLWVASLLNASSYSDLDPGEHVFSFRVSGGSDDLGAMTFTVEPDQRVTVAALNRLTDLEVLTLVDDVSAPARNAARVRIVHAVPEGSPVDVMLGDEPLAAALEYGQVSEAIQVMAGSFDLSVSAAGGDPLLVEAGRTFTGNRTYTLFLKNVPDSSALQVAEAVSTVLPASGASQFRFANMAPGVGQLTVHVNGESVPAFPEVPFSRVTHYYVTGLGRHRFDVYRIGSGPQNGAPMASIEVDIGPNESVLIAAWGNAEEIELATYTGDLSPVPPGSARLQVVHLANGNPPIKVEEIDGAELFKQIGLLKAAKRYVPAGTYSLRISDGEQTMMERTGIVIPAGALTQLIVFDNDPAAPLVNAVAVNTENLVQHAMVRWAHLNLWQPPVDVYLNETRIVAGLGYGDVTGYALLAPGRYQLSAYPAGADPQDVTPVDSREFVLASTTFGRTIFIYGSPEQVIFDAELDSLELLPQGTARVRFVNAALDTGGLDVIDPADGRLWAEGLYFDQSSVNMNIAPGSHTFEFRRGESVLASLEGATIEAGLAYTVVLTGANGQPDGLDVVLLSARP